MKQHLAAFDVNGYALVSNVLGRDVLGPIRALISRHVDVVARDLYEKGDVNSLFTKSPFERRLAALYEGRDSGIRKWSSFLFAPELYRLATNPLLLDLLEHLLGPEITFHGDFQLVPKLPHNIRQAYPWHQDTQYYGVASRHMRVITVWIPLVDVDEHNGGLWVIPGSHTWGLLDAVKAADDFFRPIENVERRGTPVPMRMAPGDVLLMTNLTFHASAVNQSAEVRWSLDFGYSATPDERTLTAKEKSSSDYLFGTLEQIGRTPFIARSPTPGRVESWDTWAERRRRGRPHFGP